MPKATSCPDVSRFLEVLQGRVAESDKETLLEHLEGCEACSQRLGALHEPDTLADLIRQAQARTGGPSAADLARLVEKMRGLGHQETLAAGGTLPESAESAGCLATPPPPGTTTAVHAIGSHADREAEWNYDFLAPAQAPDELGRLGPYRVLQVLGAGGMGMVFQAEDPHLQRLVALKAMLPKLAASPSAKQRFLREARAVAAIKHDHIVSIYQVSEDRGVPYIAMEFLDGEPLDQRLHREPRLPAAEILRLGREIAEGLEAAHERGLIHRDIKPANIWLEGKKGRVKILDFGLARASEDQAQLTQQGVIVGTPSYMAPEQATGKPVDSRCDLFSLGCVLYRLSTGALPFKGRDTVSTLLAVATETPALPGQLNRDIPQPLSDLIMDLLAKNPEERPSSAQAVVDALEGIAGKSWPDPHDTGRKKRRSAAVAVGLACLAVAGILLTLFLLRVRTEGGTLVVESDDPGIRIKVSKGGNQVTLFDPQTNKEISLQAGTYSLEIVGGKEGLKLETRDFTLHRGGKQVVRVTFEPVAAGKTLVPKAVLPSNIPAENEKVVLFDGSDLSAWMHPRGGPPSWKVRDGYLEVGNHDLSTKQVFGDCRLHLEFWIPREDGKGVPKGNSGIFFCGRYEINIMDSYDNPVDPKKACGALYDLIPVSRNASKPPEEWQTFVITFRAPQVEPVTGKVRPGKFTVVQNGVAVIQEAEFIPPPSPKTPFLSSQGPLLLQNHGSKVRFRNIWLVPLHQSPSESKVPKRNPEGLPPASSLALVRAPSPLPGVSSWTLETRRPRTGYCDVAVHPKGDQVAAATGDGTIHLLNSRTWELKGILTGHDGPVRAVAWSPDGTLLASGGEDPVPSVFLWNAASHSLVHKIPADLQNIARLAWSPDGKLLAATNITGAVRGQNLAILDPREGKLLRMLPGNPGDYANQATIGWSPDGRWVAAAGQFPLRGAQFWEAATGKQKPILPIEKQSHAFAWSPTRPDWLAVGRWDGPTIVLDITSGKEVFILDLPARQGMSDLAFSMDGKRLAGAVSSGTYLWELEKGLLLWNTPTPVSRITWTPDGRRLLGCSGTGLLVWDSRSSALEKSLGNGSRIGKNDIPKLRLSSPAWDLQPWQGGLLRLKGSKEETGGVIFKAANQLVLVGPDGHYRAGSELSDQLVYLVVTEKGQETLTPGEFSTRFGWTNDPGKVSVSIEGP